MTNDQWNHINQIVKYFHVNALTKYENGQKEHGGNLWEKSAIELVENALDEAIDQVIYLTTLRDKLLKP